MNKQKHEGIKPIFDRQELKLPESLKATEEVEHRTVKTIDIGKPEKKRQSSVRRSRSVSSSGRRNKSVRENSLSRHVRHERSVQLSNKRNRRRSYSSDRDEDEYRSRNKENGRDRLHDHGGHSSSHRPDRRDYSSKRKSSRDRSYSEERKHRSSEHNRSSRGGSSCREYRGRSRDRHERYRSLGKRERERSTERRISTLPHYIESVPVPVYYGNFPPRPVMMGHMMPMRGPMMRSRLPIGPRAPFPPRFMHPDMYRAALPPNQRFNHMF